MNLYQKLVEVRKIVPYLKKDTQSHQYTYVSGSTVLGVLKEKMDELGLLLIPTLSDIAEEKIVKPDGKIDYKVSGTVLYKWIDSESGEILEVPFYMTGLQNDSSKAFGSALTYTERYFLLKFFNIATDKDDPDYYDKKISNLTGDINDVYSRIKDAMEHLISKGYSKEDLAKVSKTHLGTENYVEMTNVKTLEKFLDTLRQLYKSPRINKAEAYELLESKRFGSSQEKEIMKEAIDKTNSEHELKRIIGTLQSRADKKAPEKADNDKVDSVPEQEVKQPENAENETGDTQITKIRDLVIKRVKFLTKEGIDDYNVKARRDNSIKKYLGTTAIEDCKDLALLTAYADVLKEKHDEWKNRGGK